MSGLAEMQAADLLALALQKESLLLTSRLLGIFKPSATELMTQKSIVDTLHAEISSSVGTLWSPQINLLRKTLDIDVSSPITVKPLRWPEVYNRNAQIAQKILKLRSYAPLVEAGGVLNNVITRQVDDTQEAVGASKGYSWRRHVDSKACEWCHDQVAQYEETGWWFRHANCKCFKVRSDR